jgi:hypothetical protein
MAKAHFAPDSRFLAHVFTSIFVAVISNPDSATAQRDDCPNLHYFVLNRAVHFAVRGWISAIYPNLVVCGISVCTFADPCQFIIIRHARHSGSNKADESPDEIAFDNADGHNSCLTRAGESIRLWFPRLLPRITLRIAE